MKNKLIRIGILCTWLTGAVCSVSAVKETNYIYLLAGGANALGPVGDAPLTPEQITNYKSYHYLWNGNMLNTGALAEPNTKWKVVAPQLPEQKEASKTSVQVLSMGPEYGFSNMMQRRKWHSGQGEVIRIIKGGIVGSMDCWKKDADGYNNFIRSMVAAMGHEDLKGRSIFRAFLWMHGEEEQEGQIPVVVQQFQDMLSRMNKDMRNGAPPLKAGENPPAEDPNAPKKVVPKWLKKGMPKLVVVGENSTQKEGDFDKDGKTVVKLMHDFVQKKKKTMGWVRTRDLKCIGNTNRYDGKSQLAIGARYAYAVAQLEGLPLPSARNDAPEASLNTPAAWWAGKMPQADGVALWDISAANTVEKLSADWNVGGLVVEDPYTNTVLIQPKNEKETPKLIVGGKGISVKDGSITFEVPLDVSVAQTWDFKTNCTISVGSKDKPVAITGNANITLEAMNNTALELYLTALPEVTWKLPIQQLKTRIMVDGKPAQFTKTEGDSYAITMIPLDASVAQTWDCKTNCTISVGSKDKPVTITGKDCITLEAVNDTALELYLTALPTVTWKLPLQQPKMTIMVNGKPARFTKAKGDSYTITMVPEKKPEAPPAQ